MKVYQTDEQGFFVGETTADPNPLEPGKYLIPAGAVTQQPPPLAEGQRAQRIDGSWFVIDPEPEPQPEPEPEPTLEEKRASADLDRVPFLEGMVALGVFTEDTAVEAADGSWPTSLDPLLSRMTFKERLTVKAEWKKNDRVPYQGPVMQAVADHIQTADAPVTVTPAQLDALFGVTA